MTLMLRRSGLLKSEFVVVAADTQARIPVGQVLQTAEKFEFSTEPYDARTQKIELTPDEREMWQHGLLPLPSPVCWYEYPITNLGGSGQDGRIGMLLMSTEKTVCINQFICGANGQIMFTPIGVAMLINQPYTPQGYLLQVTTGFDVTNRLSQAEISSICGEFVDQAIYLTLMLHSRTTNILPPTFVKPSYTEARKTGAKPYSYRVVDIVPKSYQKETHTGTGTGGRQRLHWRRSHLRRFNHQTPGSKWCPGLLGEDGVMGCFAVVIPRHLAGRRELGEIKHDYKVKK